MASESETTLPCLFCGGARNVTTPAASDGGLREAIAQALESSQITRYMTPLVISVFWQHFDANLSEQASPEDAQADAIGFHSFDPDDRFFHAKDRTWWRKDNAGKLVRVEPAVGDEVLAPSAHEFFNLMSALRSI